ncbi:MAG: BamA/TamA family outer membrane protein, partial [bacterium]|nr:BamA/TamA family outer membrane protein [bacterium]
FNLCPNIFCFKHLGKIEAKIIPYIKTKNASSSRDVSYIEYALPMTIYFNRGIIFAKPSFVDGANFWGVEKDDGTYPQKAQFDAYKLYLYSNWNLGYVSYTMAFDGQYTEDEILSSETVYIGGETSVRGFKDGVSGDSGFYVRNDFNLNLAEIFKTESLWAKLITPSLFFDYGWVKSNSDDSKNELSGAGTKLSFSYGMLDASVSYAFPIKKEDNMTSKGYTSIYVGIKGRI